MRLLLLSGPLAVVLVACGGGSATHDGGTSGGSDPGVCVPFRLASGATVCVMSRPQGGPPRIGHGSPLLAMPPSPLPARVDHRSEYLDGCIQVHDQAQCGWCTLHSTTAALEALYCSKGCGPAPRISAPHLWTSQHGTTSFDGCGEGMDPADAMAAMSGGHLLAGDDTWTYVGNPRSMMAARPSDATLAAHARYGATGEHAIGTSLDAIKRELASGREVEIAIPVTTEAGWTNGTTPIQPMDPMICTCGDMGPPACTGTCLRGYHAVVLTGYDDATMTFTFLNSWGRNWGNQGYGSMTYDFVANSQTADARVYDDVANPPDGGACNVPDGGVPDGSSGGDGRTLAQRCADATDCGACTLISGCGMCDGTCVPGNATSATSGTCTSWTFLGENCPSTGDPCAAYTDCGSCVAASGCGYCADTNRCMDWAVHHHECARGGFEVTAPATLAVDCTSCAGATCDVCVMQESCGWCGDMVGCVKGSPGAADLEVEGCTQYVGTHNPMMLSCPGPAAMCGGVGHPCTMDDDSQCCMPLPGGPNACVAGDCIDVSMCGQERTSCSVRLDCCGALDCRAQGTGTGAKTCCASPARPCNAKADCCGAMECTDGHCACRTSGESCGSTLDCCGASYCSGGVCS